MSNKVLVAVAWPYVNGDLHLGHLAGYLLPADIFARFQRLEGNDVLMVSGSDCHGTPITVEADKQGLTPLDIVNKFHKLDLELFKQFMLSYNLYTKTATDNHRRVTQELFMDLLKNGYINKGTMKQYFSPSENKFLPDRYVEGTCPHCNAKDQRSDQCEACGRWLKDGELLNPVSKLSKNSVELQDTEHYFLDFPAMAEELKKYISSRKKIWRSWVYKEALGWLEEGLEKRAITRDLDWGIDLPVEEISKLPQEKQLKNYEGKKIYVWFEAVIGYLSAPQEWEKINKANEEIIFFKQPGQGKRWEDWWKDPSARHYYFMGQDNLVFHTLMWPAQLMGSKQGYTLPLDVVVNKFMNYEGRKFSKSRSWTIDSGKMAEKYGIDLVRFYISSNLPENKESNFTWENFADSINNELVANLGNFINRTLKFLEARFEGKLSGKDGEIDLEVKTRTADCFKDMHENISNCEFVAGLGRLLALTRFGNQYFDKNKIWEVVKTDPDEAKRIMLNLLFIIFNLDVLMDPYLPEAGRNLSKMLGKEAVSKRLAVGVCLWKPEFAHQYILYGPVNPLFRKLDKEAVVKEKEHIYA